VAIHRLAVIAAGVLLGLIGVWVKLIGKSVPIMTVNWTRLALAFLLVLIFVAPFYRRQIAREAGNIRGAMVVGALMATAFSLFTTANSLAPAANVALITSLYAVITPIFAWLLLKERISLRHVIALPIAIAGVAIINPFAPQYVLGNLVSLVHPFVFASFLVFLRREERGHDIAAVFWFFLFAALFLTPLPFIFGLGNIAATWPYVLGLGFLSTGLPYVLLTYGLTKVPAPRAAIIILVSLPLSAIFLTYLILGEVVAQTTYLGGALLLTAGLIAIWKEKPKRHFVHF